MEVLIEGMENQFSLFGSLSEREMNRREQNWEELERMELDLINFLLKLPKYLYIFSHLFLNMGLILILS